jgi:hypothetical protein
MSNEAKGMLGLIAFIGCIFCLLGLTGLGYIPVSSYRFIDILIVPAIIGSMIGISSFKSYFPAVMIGMFWSSTVYMGSIISVSALPSYSPLGLLLISRVSTTVVAAASYSFWRRRRRGCPNNVYRATVAAVIAGVVVSTINGIYTGYYNHYEIDITYKFFAQLALQKLIPETVLSLIVLRAWIGKLREAHLLNGIILPPTHRKRKDSIELVYRALNVVLHTKLERPKKPCKEEN